MVLSRPTVVGTGLSAIDGIPQLVHGRHVCPWECSAARQLIFDSGGLVDKSFFALHTSRGLETQALKVFMRATVIVSEYLVYVPAVVLCVRRLSGSGQANEWQSLIALTAIMMQPATMLIDHGHFQYNTVMLGFVVASVVSILQSRPAQACVWFVAALGFKQMALFYAPAMFAYLLGSCVFPQININRLVQIATYTLSAFAALLAPFVLGVMYGSTRRDLEVEKGTATWLSSANLEHPVIAHLSQMVHRVFPFARGLFEDKVANVWCAIHSSGLYKLNRTDPVIMGRAALGLTLLSILPPCAIIFIRPRKDLVLLTLATSAWGFFLCSYQVHEKNVLLPLLPMTLLLADREGLCAEMRAWVGFANTLGCWTMFPLLKRDDLRIPYAVLTLLWTWLLDLPPVSMSLYGSESGLHNFTQLIHLAMYAAMALWHVAEAFMPPPERLPDIWVVANVCLGAAGFGICYLWCLWQLVTRSGLWSTTSKKPKTA